MKITPQGAAYKMKNTNGKIFYAKFIKKGNGEVRRMTARLHVHKGVKGVGMSYDPAKKDLLCVFDMDKADFRMINLNGLCEISLNGERYQVV